MNLRGYRETHKHPRRLETATTPSTGIGASISAPSTTVSSALLVPGSVSSSFSVFLESSVALETLLEVRRWHSKEV